MVEVFLKEYKNPEHKLANRECCDDPEKSVCRDDCSNIIWLCVSRKDPANSCDLVDERINENPVTDDEKAFDETDNRFKNPFTASLPKGFKDVSLQTRICSYFLIL